MLNWLKGTRDFELDGTNRRVTGAFWEGEGAKPESPMVLMGHGASGDRYQAPIPHLAKRLTQEAGFSVSGYRWNRYTVYVKLDQGAGKH